MGLLRPPRRPWPRSSAAPGYATGLFGKLHLTPMGYTTRTLGHDYETNDATPFLEPAGILSAATRAAVEDPMKRDYGFDVSKGVGDLTWGHYLDWLREAAPEHVQDHVAENWGLGRDGVRYGDSPPATRLLPADRHRLLRLAPAGRGAPLGLDGARGAGVRPRQRGPPVVRAHVVRRPAPPLQRGRPLQPHVPSRGHAGAPDELDREACFPPDLPEPVANKIGKFAAPGPEFWQWARANYYGMVSHLDWCVGRLLDGLEAMGAARRHAVRLHRRPRRVRRRPPPALQGVAALRRHHARAVRLGLGRPAAPAGGPAQSRWRSRSTSIPPCCRCSACRCMPGCRARTSSSMLRGGPEIGYDRVTCELDQLPGLPVLALAHHPQPRVEALLLPRGPHRHALQRAG